MLTLATTIKAITYDAEWWELYYLPGREEAARAVNVAIQEAFNDGGDIPAVLSAAGREMKKHSHLGMCDSEALRRLDDIMAKLFPKNYRR